LSNFSRNLTGARPGVSGSPALAQPPTGYQASSHSTPLIAGVILRYPSPLLIPG